MTLSVKIAEGNSSGKEIVASIAVTPRESGGFRFLDFFRISACAGRTNWHDCANVVVGYGKV